MAVGVQLGTTGAYAAMNIPNTAGVREFDAAPDAIRALANGDVDAVIMDLPVALSIIASNPDLNVVIVDDTFTAEYYGIAVRKDCPDLLDAVNEGLAAVIQSGTYADIYATYFGVQPGEEFQAGAQGLMLGEVMNPATPEPTAEATEVAYKTFIIINVDNPASLKIRSGPGTSFAVLALAARGERFAVIGRTATGDWYQIILPDSRRAWVTGQFVLLSPADAQVPVVSGP